MLPMRLLQALVETNLWLFAAVLFGLFLVATEIGFRFGRREAARRDADEKRQGGAATLIGGMLALVAFMLGLTINFAQNRFESRRQEVVQEANTIGTAWLRAKLVGGEEGEAIAALIADYTRVRLDYTRADFGGPEAALLARTGAMQGRMWQILTPLARRAPTPVVTSLVAALNDMFDASLSQRAAFESRVPAALTTMLLAGALLSLGALGFQFGLQGSRQVMLMLLLLLMWVGAMTLIVDFNRPRLGALRVDTAPLRWTLEGFSLPPPPP